MHLRDHELTEEPAVYWVDDNLDYKFTLDGQPCEYVGLVDEDKGGIIAYGPYEHIKDLAVKANHLAYVTTARREYVDYVLSQSETDPDGRSNWLWIRLSNGDLFLGVAPQGDTYFAVEEDADLQGRV